MAEKDFEITISSAGFPDSFAPDTVKDTPEYGLQIARAIEYEWLRKDRNSCLYWNRWRDIHRLRRYARGEQDIAKYKNELAYDGDLSKLNLDWTPVPILPKFVDLIVNGMQDRLFKVRAEAVDALSANKRSRYQEEIEAQMVSKDLMLKIQEGFNVDPFTMPVEDLPENDEELDLHMQLNYKPAIEIAQELGITTLMEKNWYYDDIKWRHDYDLVTIGIGAVKHSFDPGVGVRVSYVDPANLVWSYTEDPHFKDCFYFGEVKVVPISELVKIRPDISNAEMDDISQYSQNWYDYYNVAQYYDNDLFYKDTCSLLYFSYKTTRTEKYKKKMRPDGSAKVIEKGSDFNPPTEMMEEGRFEVIEKKIEVWYDGILVLGTDILLKWELQKNMVRPKSASQYCFPTYIVNAPRMYKGTIESVLRRMIPFGDQIQLTHLKLQQVLQRMVPDGVFIDADGINQVDLGEGSNYSPQDALRLYFQTGSVIGRSMTEDGEFNHARIPIQELSNSAGLQKIQALVASYNHYLDMLRGVTGINEARDATDPDPRSLVGVQKLMALNSNTATRHILDGSLNIAKTLAECLSLRMSDILQYADFAEEFANQIGKYNVSIIEEIKDAYLYDFGIFLEIMPDEEEKARLEENIQRALDKENINLEDAIDIREIGNVKLANQLLKVKRKKKQEQDEKSAYMRQEQINQGNAQLQQAKAQADMMLAQMKAQGEANAYTVKGEQERSTLSHEAMLKAKLMAYEFKLSVQKFQAEQGNKWDLEKYKEDRKDDRTKLQATQQSEMIAQRTYDTPSIDFESKNDDLGGVDMDEIGVGL